MHLEGSYAMNLKDVCLNVSEEPLQPLNRETLSLCSVAVEDGVR